LVVDTDSLAVLYLSFDIFFSGLFLLLFPRSHELLIICFAIFSYYAYAFGLNDILGQLDYERITILGRLSTMGLLIPEDLHAFQVMLLVYKSLFMIFAISFFPQKSKIDWYFLHAGAETVPLVWITFGLFLTLSASSLTGLGFFSILAVYFYLCLSILVILRIGALSLGKRVCSLVAFVLLSFVVTRSRTGVAVVLLYPLGAIIQQYGVRSMKVFLMGIGALLIVSSYGLMRDGGLRNWLSGNANDTPKLGFEALGEAGHVYLTGSHITGLASRDDLDSSLSEGLLEKAWRVLPLVQKQEPLADRYVSSYFSALLEDGGGWAYSSIAEWYVWGGYIGIGLFALGSAALLSRLASISLAFKWRVLFLVTAALIMRTESSVVTSYILYISAALSLFGFVFDSVNSTSIRRQIGAVT
jgi:hypothetical protein